MLSDKLKPFLLKFQPSVGFTCKNKQMRSRCANWKKKFNRHLAEYYREINTFFSF